MEVIGCLVAVFFVMLCAAIISSGIEESLDKSRRTRAEKRKKYLLRKNFEWRRKRKSPFVWDTGGKDPFQHLDTTYMSVIAESDYRERQIRKVLELCGAKFLKEIDGFYYSANRRIPVVNSYGKTVWFQTTNNSERCLPDEMPELSHFELLPSRRCRMLPRGEGVPKEGDVVFIGHYRDGWLARVVKIFKRDDCLGSQIFKLEPVFSTPENPNGWICGNEIEYAYMHNTPPVPSKESIACA